MDLTVADALELLRGRARDGRILVALAGPPGAGKSTLASGLADGLAAEGVAACVVPMDGFHLDDAILDEMGWRPRKGAPHTYDVDGLRSLLERLRRGANSEIFYPVFDRATESARAAAGRVRPNDRVIIVEGNYLLLDEPEWREIAALFDVKIMVTAPLDTLKLRLLDRWSELEPQAALAKVEGNDLNNAELVLSRSLAADMTISA
jgi:pantothenate kinase